MVSQTVWLGVRDVFTQIAKDVVGEGLYHDTLTFKPPSEGKRIFVHDATSILDFSSSQMSSMLFRDSLGTTETERNALVIKDFS
uniref:Uncharacterized protein n=1 Tax=Brassica oleracea var. oleracea TaxID=109376 RepID=A0A0D3CK42_BRAOL